MLAIRRLPFASLRARLSAAAMAGLITTVSLAGLLLLTAWSASEVVTSARLMHERVSVYTRIQDAARDYQGASYRSVRETGPQAQRKVVETRARLEVLLARAARLPAFDRRDREAQALVARQGRALVDQYRHPDRLVAGVNRKWREEGSRAAMREVERLTQPMLALKGTLTSEIERGDSRMSAATGDAQRLIGLAVVASLAGLILALAISAVGEFLLRTRLRPGLSRLEAGAEAFGSGQLDHRIALDGRDELARLSRAFDTMAATIQDKQEDLREIQHGLERAVAERTEELQQANAKLAAADELRRAFLADVSHELRTPLTIIRGEAQVALRTADQQFDTQESFARILEQTEDLSRMVNDLFLIALAEAGRLPLDRKVLDLRELGARLAGDFETLAFEMGGTIRALPGPPVFATVDSCRLRRALSALVENALRHCPRGVSIVLETRSTGDGVAISVSDDGPGLDFAKAHELFERFRRGETRGEGSGLGLSLVHALVQAHGGRTELTARHGGGTVATMFFPLDASQQVAA